MPAGSPALPSREADLRQGDRVLVSQAGSFATGKQGTVVAQLGPGLFAIWFLEDDPPLGYRFLASELRLLPSENHRGQGG